MNFDPKLKNAMEEIKQILKNYDIAGVVVLHSPGHNEYMLKLDPSFSAATVSETGVRITATEALYGKAKRDKLLDDTVNMVVGLAEVTAMQATNLIDLQEMLEKKFEIIKKEGGHTTHETQNN